MTEMMFKRQRTLRYLLTVFASLQVHLQFNALAGQTYGGRRVHGVYGMIGSISIVSQEYLITHLQLQVKVPKLVALLCQKLQLAES